MLSTESLCNRIKQLEQENTYLKSLLEQAGISYTHNDDYSEHSDAYAPNQGARILPRTITKSDANRFFSMFWGRTDVYSKRSIKKATGEVGYYPQCRNLWSNGCHRLNKTNVKCKDCKKLSYRKLEIKNIIEHLQGNSENATDVIGVYPLLPDDTCRFLVYDFDNHDVGAEKRDYANTDDAWKEEVDAMREICRINGIDALVERSRSGKGAHLWIFFEKPIEAALVRKFGNALLRKGSESVNLKSFRFYDRMLPMQDHLPPGGLGNLIALPLQGQALLEGNSAFIDEDWNTYPDQWEVLFEKPKLTQEFIEEKIKEWQGKNQIQTTDGKEFHAEEENPWENKKDFCKSDVDGTIRIVLADAVYVETKNLKPQIQNRIRELAAFSNPKFYKNQVMGLSNFQNARYIYLGQDVGDYIKIPRGLSEKLIEQCEKAGIVYRIEDKRCSGREIDVTFCGELKDSQIPAVRTLAEKDTGILSAATAFGKTVVCCNLIAEKKVNTLILLQQSSLMPQWENAFNKFLQIEEEPPEYETPTGRRKRRKSVIGTLQGSRDTMTGIIDIAMVGSLCKKGEFHEKLKDYGLVVLDECHHAAADTIVNVLQEVRARYVYGVTATPFRGDGMEKVNFMLLGPIRYLYSSKERAKEQGIAHLVYPRFTRAVMPRFQQERVHPNEVYAVIRDNDDRDELILRDVRKCIEDGRTPVVLSKYVDHSQKIFERLQGYADHIFMLTGQNSKKAHREILEQMGSVCAEESMILVATGSLIGEGFDFPRLDTLIMATPVSGRNVVEQYAGRLNRDYEGKENVIIYDYVDSHISMFDKMYYKRLKAYKQIGYDVFSGEKEEKQEANAIFDIDNYAEVFHRDLLEAHTEVIISSPAISAKKVYEIMDLLREKQEAGVHVIIVTWHPDDYGYGDSHYWMKLQEEMRSAGFEMNLVEDYCEHYCVVDKEIVWYGSMNFLGKEDAEDNLMRVRDKGIASEVLELTFGKNENYRLGIGEV